MKASCFKRPSRWGLRRGAAVSMRSGVRTRTKSSRNIAARSKSCLFATHARAKRPRSDRSADEFHRSESASTHWDGDLAVTQGRRRSHVTPRVAVGVAMIGLAIDAASRSLFLMPVPLRMGMMLTAAWRTHGRMSSTSPINSTPSVREARLVIVADAGLRLGGSARPRWDTGGEHGAKRESRTTSPRRCWVGNRAGPRKSR